MHARLRIGTPTSSEQDLTTVPTRPPSPRDVATGEPSPPRRRLSLSALVRLLESRTLRLVFLAAVLALLAVALIERGPKLWHDARQLSLGAVGLAFVGALAGTICSLMVWRTLLADLGSRLSLTDACRVMFIGQLGKYVPGSIWPVLAQMELSADHGVPRGRTGISVMLSSGVMACTGTAVAAVTLPIGGASSEVSRYWSLLAVPVGVVVLCPPVLNRLIAMLLRMLRRGSLVRGVSWRGLSLTLFWALLGWTCYGLMTYAVLGQIAGHGVNVLLVSIGAFALSWVAGFLAVFSPAGAGVREVVMVAVLSALATTGVALTVALVTRGLIVVGDALTGAAAGALVGRRRLRELRARRDQGAS